MTCHPDARSIRRVSLFIDRLRTLFDPKKYPWFGDEFIHPRDIARTAGPRPAESLLPITKAIPSFRTG
jgi:hypothetical protein